MKKMKLFCLLMAILITVTACGNKDAETVVNSINNLPEATAENYDEIMAVKDMYDNLSASEQSKVTNVQLLNIAVEKVENAKAADEENKALEEKKNQEEQETLEFERKYYETINDALFALNFNRGDYYTVEEVIFEGKGKELDNVYIHCHNGSGKEFYLCWYTSGSIIEITTWGTSKKIANGNNENSTKVCEGVYKDIDGDYVFLVDLDDFESQGYTSYR